MLENSFIGVLAEDPKIPGVVVFLVLGWLAQYFMSGPKKLNVPVVKFGDKKLMDVVVEGKNKYPNQPFTLDTMTDTVILPISQIDEIKNAPEDKLDFLSYTKKHFLSQWSNMTIPPEPVIKSIKVNLTRNIAKVTGDLQEETRWIFGNVLPKDCSTWTPLPVMRTASPIVAGLSARTFVGLPLCRDPEWLQATITYTGAAIQVLMTLTKWHPLLRPIVAPFLECRRKVLNYSGFAARKLKPQMDAILEQYRQDPNKKVAGSGGVEGEFNMVHWILGNSPDVTKVSPVELGNNLMALGFASVHTTSTALGQALYDMAAYPQYLEDLREELETVLAEDGTKDGFLGKTAFPKLKKLDSFLKESQRMNPSGPINFHRQVIDRKGFKLSTGEVLPHGTAVSFITPFIPNSKTPSDNLVNNPSQPPLEQFAPWRFYELRKLPGEENKHQWVTATQDSTVFGVGPHACPGRFFANNEIKIIVAELIRNYDFALGPNGERDGQGGFVRPPSVQTVMSNSPDSTGVVYIRKRAKKA